MKNTNNTPKLNPEIKEQAVKLFSLIEEFCQEHGDDKADEAMAEQMGDFLRNSHGFRELHFAWELSRPKSEVAIFDLEEALRTLRPEDLDNLFDFVDDARRATEMLLDEDKEFNKFFFNCIMKNINKAVPDFLQVIHWEYWSRAKGYEREIRKIKEGQNEIELKS